MDLHKKESKKMRQINYKGVDIFQLVASLYNCADIGYTSESATNQEVFITRDQVKAYLGVAKKDYEPPGRLAIAAMEFEGVRKELGISTHSHEYIISKLYDRLYGRAIVSKVIAVLRFFIDNRVTLGSKNKPSVYREAARALSTNEQPPRYYQIRLRSDALALMCTTFSFIDITYMSINMLYELVTVFSCKKNELVNLYNDLNLALRDSQRLKRNMLLINPSEELQKKALNLKKGLIALLWDYKNRKEEYEKTEAYTPSC